MSGTPHLLAVTDRYPSSQRPEHGVQVHERLRRLAPALGWSLQIVECDPERADDSGPVEELLDGIPVVRLGAAPAVRRWFGLRRPGAAPGGTAVPRVLEHAEAAAAPVVLDLHGLRGWTAPLLGAARSRGLPAWVTPGAAGLTRLAAHTAALRAEVEVPRGWILDDAIHAARLADALGESVRPRCLTVRDGVDLELFGAATREAGRRALGIPTEAVLLTGFGPITTDSGLPLLARALRELPEVVHLAVVGRGPESATLQSAVPPERLHLLGERTPADRAALLVGSDLTVLPGRVPPAVPALEESLAAGVRVLATPEAGDPEVLGRPRLGGLIRYDDRAALVREISRLLRAPSEPAQIRGFAQRFAWDDPIGKLVDLFRDVTT